MKFSVIIPVYNAARYLRHSLHTLLKQDFGDWEAVCVNDGSSDGSLEILQELAARDARIRIIDQPNQGVSAARNRALEEARGDWLLFLDADDGLCRDALSVLSATLDCVDVDLLQFSYWSVSAIEETTASLPVEPDCYDLTSPEGARAAYIRTGTLGAWNGCFRRACVQNVRFEKLPIGEDMLYGFRCFTLAQRYAFLARKLYLYRQRSDSAINTVSLAHALSCIESFQSMVEAIRSWKQHSLVADLVQKRIRTTYFGQTYSKVRALRGNDFKEALGCFFSAGEGIAKEMPLFGFVFRRRSRFLFLMMGYFPYCCRVALLKLSFVAYLRRIIRGLCLRGCR